MLDDDGGVTVGHLMAQELLQLAERVHRLIVCRDVHVMTSRRERGNGAPPGTGRDRFLLSLFIRPVCRVKERRVLTATATRRTRTQLPDAAWHRRPGAQPGYDLLHLCHGL